MATETPEPTPDPVEETPEVADELDDEDFDDVAPPPEDDAVPEAPATEEPEVEAPEDEVDEEDSTVEPAPKEKAMDDTPDFSQYKTNVYERLFRAKKAAEGTDVDYSINLVTRTEEYQAWRTKMALLTKYIDEYSTAMKTVSEKRDQLFKQYALLSEDTPLFDYVGKPLTDEQVSEMKESGDLVSLEGIEEKTKSIMKVAEEVGPGSLVAHQQLAMMQDEMNIIDYERHSKAYIEEWESVVTSQLDSDVQEFRDVTKIKDHYIQKVDGLRKKVNKLNEKGKKGPSTKLSDQLARNEKKLSDADAAYEAKSKEVSVGLYEATQRSWVDLYPVIKNVMKFEINRLGRESSCYGSYHATLTELKGTYKEATKGTPDEPNAGSAL